MAAFVALFFTALIAISQAAPRPQNDVNTASQQTSTNNGPSPPGGLTSTTSNTGSPAAGTSPGTANPPGPVAIIVPPELMNNFFPFISAGGTTSSNGGSTNSPIAAIISLIPNVINVERDRFGKAVGTLMHDNAEAIGDIINSAATTGGKFLSNGVKLVSTWPTFFGDILG